jgi:hypothetical protein
MSAKESLGYYKFKNHKKWVNKGCSELLDKENKPDISGYMIQAKWMGIDWTMQDVKPSGISGIKQWNI